MKAKIHQKLKLYDMGPVSKALPMLAILSLAIIGVYYMNASHATSPFVSVGATSGIFSGEATTINDGTASGGSKVHFGATINPAPAGPASPTSGWHVDFADDFNAPLGTGPREDNLWYPNQLWSSPTSNANGFNGSETEVYNSSQVTTNNGTLALTARYQNDVAPATGNGSGSSSSNEVQRNYVSGIVTTPTTQSGYKGFSITLGDSSTWAFEIECQWPVNTGELWDAFATNSLGTWVNERDFFEGKSPANYIDTDWIYSTVNTGGELQDYFHTTLGYDPANAMHRYTYVIYPDQSWSFYIDGALKHGLERMEYLRHIHLIMLRWE